MKDKIDDRKNKVHESKDVQKTIKFNRMMGNVNLKKKLMSTLTLGNASSRQ